MQSTNCQVSVEAFVTANRVVCAKVRVYGATKVADAIKNVLGKWVPTAEVPIELGMSDTQLWKETKDDAEHGDTPNPRSPAAHGFGGR